MYLENIFIGSEDIRKQLPQESVLFEGVHATFQQKMKELQTISNVVQVNTWKASSVLGSRDFGPGTSCLRAGLRTTRHARHLAWPMDRLA